jgi:hypothetical protein
MDGTNGSGNGKLPLQIKPIVLTRKPLLFLSLTIFITIRLTFSCQAQLAWKNVDTAYGPLPGSVHVFRSADSLNGFPFVAYYVSARLKDKKLLFTAQTGLGKRFTPLQYYQLEQFPLLVVNCTFFSFTTNQNLNLVMKDGKIVAYNVNSLKGTGKDSLLYYYPTRAAIGIDRQRRADVAWIFTDSLHRKPYAFEDMPVVAKGDEMVPSIYDLRDVEWKWWKMRTAVGGGPTLIHNGKIRITNREEQLFPGGEGDHHPRTAMGYTRDGRLIVLAIQGRAPGVAAGATLEEEARILLDLGCYEALNLDGGGSSCLLVNGKETIKPSDKEGERPLPAVFLIKRKAP